MINIIKDTHPLKAFQPLKTCRLLAERTFFVVMASLVIANVVKIEDLP